MINEGESGLTRLGHHSVLTLAFVERQTGNPLKKKDKQAFPCRVALTGVNNDRGRTFLLALPRSEWCIRLWISSVNTQIQPQCQCDSCCNGSFGSNGCGGSEPTEHTAGHPGFGD